MRIVLQRVSRASVAVDGETIAQIGPGLLLLVGISSADTSLDFRRAAQRIVDLRIFEDDERKMNRSLRDIEGSVLVVSQFTLYADVSKGRRPSFLEAAAPAQAEPLFDLFVQALEAEGVEVRIGKFGANMAVDLENDGPVTLVLEVAVQDSTG